MINTIFSIEFQLKGCKLKNKSTFKKIELFFELERQKSSRSGRSNMRTLLLALLFLSTFPLPTLSQDCAPPPIVLNAKAQNIFSPQQEMYLGDVEIEQLEKNYHVIDDAAVNEYLQSIGDRLSKHLPATGIRFRFYVADLPATNAFTLAGGRIFVTRKLISFVKSEDELAFVIGHELGHATVRHGAIDMTRIFKEVLGVTSVGDRRDVFEKYHRYLEAYATKRVSFSNDHEDNKQLEADSLGVYAIYAAGYDPTAMVAFWKRFTNAKKVGFWGAFFGERRPVDKRLGEMITALKTIPAACLDKLAASRRSDFETWKSVVINYSGFGAKESLNGLMYRRPLVPMRSEIRYLRFSPDGQYILAQDESTVTVLKREPLSVVFRVDVEDAFPAIFSTDSSKLIVYNHNLRVQQWNISDKRLISTYEVALPSVGYWQTRISPAGNYVACYAYNADLIIYDVATGNEIYKEKEFYLPSRWDVFFWEIFMDILDLREIPALNLEFSPDGRYLLAGKRTVGGSWSSISQEKTTAVDLFTGKKISIGDNVKKILLTSMDFMGPNKVIGQYGNDPKKSGIFTFPDGERLAQLDLTGSSFTAGYSGDLITIRPVAGAAVGLYDINQKKFLLGNAKSALDVYDRTFVAEKRDGEIGLFNADTRENFASIALPTSPFGRLRTTELSADGNWLVASDRSRGAGWDLRTGERKVHVRTFRGAYIAPDGLVYADFPKQGKSERFMGAMDLKKGTVNVVGDIVNEDNIRQFGRYLMLRKPLKEKKEKEKTETEEDKRKTPFSEEGTEKPIPDKEILMEMHEVQTGGLLWKREFQNERPAFSLSSAHDSMLLAWYINSEAAKQIIGNSPTLKAKREKMANKEGDQLIEIIDPKTGEIKGDFLLETGEGSFSPEYLTLAGDYLLINDNHNRILVYSSTTGDLLTRFFGNYAAVSPATKQVAVENSPGRVTIYDVLTGAEITKLSFIHPLSLMQFTQGGQRLFVLTTDQTAFMFDTAKFTHEDTFAGNQ